MRQPPGKLWATELATLAIQKFSKMNPASTSTRLDTTVVLRLPETEMYL